MTRDITDVVKLDRHAEAIRAAGKRAVSNIFRIGRHLIEAKDLCGHGKWSAWLDNEFGWSADTAERYMQTARMIENRNVRNLPDLSISRVYLLARPSTTEEVRREVPTSSKPLSRSSARAPPCAHWRQRWCLRIC